MGVLCYNRWDCEPVSEQLVTGMVVSGLGTWTKPEPEPTE